MRKLLGVSFLVLLAASPAFAQDERPVSFNFGAGPTIPVGGFNDAFDTGWNGIFGATFNISPTVGVLAEYSYQWMSGPERTITVFPTPTPQAGTSQLLESNHHMHTGTFDLVYKAPTGDRKFGGYVLGGGGFYHRTVEITSPSVGYTTFCDPYWYVCYPALVEVDRIIGDRSSTDFGMNFGGGLTFGSNAKFYVETRCATTTSGARRSPCPRICRRGPRRRRTCPPTASTFRSPSASGGDGDRDVRAPQLASII
jgi:hypothetical protein